MNAPSPGWYPDPSGSPQLRWWDGYQWTHDVAPLAPPPPGATAAPPPPHQPAAPTPAPAAPARRSVADAAPGTVLFDEKISGVGVSSRQLRITPETATWGKSTVPLDQIHGVASWVTIHRTNGIEMSTERFFVFVVPDATWKVPLPTLKLNPSKKHNAGYFDRLVEISEHLIEPRLCREAVQVIEAGKPYTAGSMTLDRSGIRSDARGAPPIVWSAVEQVDLVKGQLVITGSGGGKPLTLSMHTINAMVVARAISVCANRFG